MSKFHSKQNFFLRHFPPPKFLKMPFVGLTISDTYIRFIEFKNSKKGIALKGFGKKALPEGVVDKGYIHNKEKLTDALKELKAEYKFEFIKTALPEDKVYLFRVDIPWVEEDEIRDVLELKIEESVPVKLEDAVFDYNAIYKNKSEDTISLVVSVCPSQTVEAYLDVFKNADLTPLSLAVESQAMSQAIIQKGDDRTYLVINAEKTRTNIFIASDEVVQFTSSSTSLEGLDNSLNISGLKSANADPEDKNLIKKDSSGYSSHKVIPNQKDLEAISSDLSFLRIKEEIGKIKDYWNNHRIKRNEKDKKIEKILLLGEFAGLETLAQALGKEIGLDADVADVWANAFSTDEYVPEISYEESLEYASTIGSALPDTR